MMGVFLLGPTKWRKGGGVDGEDWLLDHVPNGHAEGRLSPLHVRQALRAYLGDRGVRCVVMEDETTLPGETLTSKFQRIRRRRGITQFFVYWPALANRTGLDVELGFLLQRLESTGGFDVRRADVRLFVQGTSASLTPGGLLVHERGARTKYYGDLVLHRCPIIVWDTNRELFEAIGAHARP